MRSAFGLTALGLVAILSMAVSVPTSAPPLEELAMGAMPPVAELALAGFPVVTVDDLVEGAQPRTTAIPHISPEKFQNLIVEPKGTCNVDFAALAVLPTSLGTPCRESSNCTITGGTAALTDACLASSDFGQDGGSALLSTATLSCRVTSSTTIAFKLCVQLTDAGSYDPPAQDYTGRVIH